MLLGGQRPASRHVDAPEPQAPAVGGRQMSIPDANLSGGARWRREQESHIRRGLDALRPENGKLRPPRRVQRPLPRGIVKRGGSRIQGNDAEGGGEEGGTDQGAHGQ